MSFKHYFSLGVNCEGAFQIRRVLGRDSSCFFSWNVTSFTALHAILKSRFEGVCQLPNLAPPAGGLIHDSSYDFKFHFPSGQEWCGPGWEENFLRIQKKMMYLAKKFSDVAASGEAIAYFYRTEEKVDVQEKARQLVDVLKQYHSGMNFRVIVIQAKDMYEADWNEPFLANRYLARTAPWSDATDGHVRSWDRIFSEFPHATLPLRLAGFDKVSNPLEETTAGY